MLSIAMQLEAIMKAPLYPTGAEEGAAIPRLTDQIDEIEALIRRYVALPEFSLAAVIATWICGTYLYERFRYFGYLALRSATPGCGKSHLLKLVARFSQGNPPIAIAPTAAVLFRSPRKVWILDEVDRFRNQDKETFGQVLMVLNAGFEKDGMVERVEKVNGTWTPVQFRVYGPKALAGIESLADTLASRCFMIQMQRAPQRMPRMNERRLQTEFERVRANLELWAQAHGDEVEEAYTGLDDEVLPLKGLEDRFQDIAEPLVVIATMADSERPEGPQVLSRLLTGLRAAAGRREPSGRENQLVAFLEMVEERLNGSPEVFIPSGDLRMACQDREELASLETDRALAGFLKNFDLRPGHNPTKTKRGYRIRAEWVQDWKARYRVTP